MGILYMKLLILTQKIDKNDPVLGFFHEWVGSFAKKVERVTVICLYRGEYSFPDNVQVLSLGKEEGVRRLSYIVRFYKYIFTQKDNYDSVFVHMNQIYVVLGGFFWRVMRKKVGLWYAHGHTPLSLYGALLFTHFVFTSTKSGFRIASKKRIIVGQGIDTELFAPKIRSKEDGMLHILAAGRMSPVKDFETLIRSIDLLRRENIRVTIVGGAETQEQKQYLATLKKLVATLKLEERISFKGAVPNKEIAALLQNTDLFVNTSLTGSLDKTMPEALSSGVLVVTCNEAFVQAIGDEVEEFVFEKKNPAQLAEKIKKVQTFSVEEKRRLTQQFRAIVEGKHSLSTFTEKILRRYE